MGDVIVAHYERHFNLITNCDLQRRFHYFCFRILELSRCEDEQIFTTTNQHHTHVEGISSSLPKLIL